MRIEDKVWNAFYNLQFIAFYYIPRDLYENVNKHYIFIKTLDSVSMLNNFHR
jgi:hypothetical protein